MWSLLGEYKARTEETIEANGAVTEIKKIASATTQEAEAEIGRQKQETTRKIKEDVEQNVERRKQELAEKKATEETEQTVEQIDIPVVTYSQTSNSYENSYREPIKNNTENKENNETDAGGADSEAVEEVSAEEENITNESSVQTANGTVKKQDSSHFKRDGVIYDENGTRYTWYSSNVLHHYRTSEWEAGDDGFYRTSDGNLVVASEDYPEGTIIDTPYGTAEVLDSGCDSGTVDFYVNY